MLKHRVLSLLVHGRGTSDRTTVGADDLHSFTPLEVQRPNMVSSRVPAETISAIDHLAAKNATTRSDAIKQLIETRAEGEEVSNPSRLWWVNGISG